MDLYLKAPGDGHVIGFTLPLHPTIERQWRDGILFRVNSDGTPYLEGPFAELPDGGEADGGSGDTVPAPLEPGEHVLNPAALTEPVRPAPNASKGDWVAYAQALGLDIDPKMTKPQIVELVTPSEMQPDLGE